MPNCDFYATPEDHEQLLHWLFSENTCRAFELSSDFEQPLKEFHSVSDVLSQFGRTYSTVEKWHTVHLQLYVLGACPPFAPRRIQLNPKACDGATFRYEANGWGLVQLYLATATAHGLNNSHTNHNSQKRAEVWAPTIPTMQEVSLWDFKKISAFSSRLNRQVKNLSVAKIGSRPILSGAFKLWQEGTLLLPFHNDNSTIVLHADA
jgi:hypothetical protein